MSEISKAVAILIDNSATSMNGDFYPTRLRAQLITAGRYAQHLFTICESSQVALGTLGNTEFGIRASFTSSTHKIENTFGSINSSGYIDLAKGLKCAVLALHHCSPQEKQTKRILAFVGSSNDITRENGKEIAKLLSNECIGLDLVVMGESIPNQDILKEFVYLINPVLQSKCLLIPRSNTILSDDVISSAIEPINHTLIRAPGDPELQAALKMSQHHQKTAVLVQQQQQQQQMLQQQSPPYQKQTTNPQTQQSSTNIAKASSSLDILLQNETKTQNTVTSSTSRRVKTSRVARTKTKKTDQTNTKVTNSKNAKDAK